MPVEDEVQSASQVKNCSRGTLWLPHEANRPRASIQLQRQWCAMWVRAVWARAGVCVGLVDVLSGVGACRLLGSSMCRVGPSPFLSVGLHVLAHVRACGYLELSTLSRARP